MDKLLLSFKAIMPVFLPMFIGYLAKKLSLVQDTMVPGINTLIFKLFLPVMLFCNIYTGDGMPTVEPKLLWFSLTASVIFFLILILVMPRFISNPKRRGAFIHTSVRSNMAIIGLPIAAALCSEELLPVVSTAIAIAVIPNNILGILSLELNRENQKANFFKSVIYALKNKVIIAIIIAIILNIAHIKLPQLLLTPLKEFGAVTPPLSFFILGASFTFTAAAKNKTIITVVTLLRLIIIPLLALISAVALGFRGVELTSIFVMFASPTAVSTYAVSSALNSDAKLTSEIIVFTSAFSIITVFLWILAITSLGLVS